MKRLVPILSWVFAMVGVSSSAIAGEIVPTAAEERALLLSMQGLMQRLEDPAWFQLMQEHGDGCWIDKQTLVAEGYETEFARVPSRCVSIDLGLPEHRAFLFMPTRIVEACDAAKQPYAQCVE